MTRETKIGLLVGLLFIIAFGLVLSGLTNKDSANNNLPSGELAKSPGDVSPDLRVSSYTPEIEEPVAAEGGATSGTTETATSRQDGSDKPTVTVDLPVPDASSGRNDELAPVQPRLLARTPSGRETFGMHELTARSTDGEDPALGDPVETVESARTAGPVAVSDAPAGEVWEVKKGDTLYGIAGQKYGRTNASKYKRIIEANRDIIKSEKDLKIGMKLRIPPLDGSPSDTVAPAGPAPMERPIAVPARVSVPEVAVLPSEGARESAAPATPGRVYKVQRGDTLYGISHRHGVSIEEILKANPTKLKSQKDSLRIGTELTLR